MRRFAILSLLVVLVGGLLVAPAAAQPPELPEEKIWVLCDLPDLPDCIPEFPAGEPFWIGHGAFFPHGKGYNQKGIAPAAGHYDFKLSVDGEEVEEDWTFHGFTQTFNVFLFPEGLTGEHEFQGEWLVPCLETDVGVEPGCEKKNDVFSYFWPEVDPLTIDFN